MVYASINASVVDAKKVSMGVQLREKPVVKMTKERPPRNRESEPGRAKKAQKKKRKFLLSHRNGEAVWPPWVF